MILAATETVPNGFHACRNSCCRPIGSAKDKVSLDVLGITFKAYFLLLLFACCIVNVQNREHRYFGSILVLKMATSAISKFSFFISNIELDNKRNLR
jgi:uncharacterized membrane protein